MIDFLYCVECNRETGHRPDGECMRCGFVTPSHERERPARLFGPPGITGPEDIPVGPGSIPWHVGRTLEETGETVSEARAAELFAQMRRAL